ncbi:MAG: serine hydrolase [Bacteroidetes bacterium]|nr:serine hydrolase [Bacteroidota bacterium]
MPINKEKVPCIQLIITDSLKNTWSLATGTADVKRRQAVNNDNLLRLSSIRKTFTASVIFFKS